MHIDMQVGDMKEDVLGKYCNLHEIKESTLATVIAEFIVTTVH